MDKDFSKPFDDMEKELKATQRALRYCCAGYLELKYGNRSFEDDDTEVEKQYRKRLITSRIFEELGDDCDLDEYHRLIDKYLSNEK